VNHSIRTWQRTANEARAAYVQLRREALTAGSQHRAHRTGVNRLALEDAIGEAIMARHRVLQVQAQLARAHAQHTLKTRKPAASSGPMEHTPDSQPPAPAPAPAEASPYATMASDLARKLAGLAALASDADPYGNAGHDTALCDCSACTNWRHAVASHAAPAPESPAEPEPTPGQKKHGGYRPGSGSKRRPVQKKKQSKPAYVHLTPKEKREVEAKAYKADLSISAYIRKRLGFPTAS